LDAFFASVEQLDNSRLRGEPVVVGGSPDKRGVVAAASYEARKLGARSAMPMRSAMKLSTKIIRVDSRFERYRELSTLVMDCFRLISKDVEQLSLDEAYVDISDKIYWSQKIKAASDLKRKVLEITGLNITIGGGANKSVAKIASQVAKPDGILLVPVGDETKFMAPLRIELISGVGPATQSILAGHNIQRISQLASADRDWLFSKFGKRGIQLQDIALGIDNRKIEARRDRKSISAETTMDTDISDPEELLGILARLVSDVVGKLNEKHLFARTIKIKFRLGDFRTFTRQLSFDEPTNEISIINDQARNLFHNQIDVKTSLRLIGFGVSNLVSEGDLDIESVQNPIQLKLNLNV
jgi:DNA polymerase-4